MAVFRCPKHDVLFQAEKAPTQHGHGKCPFCNPNAPKSHQLAEDTFGQPQAQQQADKTVDDSKIPTN
jgi:hypothetical protein